MKSYRKFKNLPIQVILAVFFALLAQYKIQPDTYLGSIIIWLVMPIFVIILDYTTYAIEVSTQAITIRKLFRKAKVLNFKSIRLIRFEGYFIRGHWLIMSLYDHDRLLVSAEISSLCSRDFFQTIIKIAAVNGITLDFDDDAKKILK